MGLFDKLKGQLIDVIEWTDGSRDTIVYRFPTQDREIQTGAHLTVRESQAAVFFDKGRIADIFGPGKYTLSTDNLPVLTMLQNWGTGFRSPFKSEVYFVNLRQFTDQKWGTANPVMMRDPDFGVVRIRGYGVFAFRVVDVRTFMLEVVGTDFRTSLDDIAGYLRRIVVSAFTDVMGEAKVPALDLAARYDELGLAARERLAGPFRKLGIEATEFRVENLNLPDEVQAAIDKRASMGVLGDMDRYQRFQMAEAMGRPGGAGGGMADAAQQMAGMAMGLRMGERMAGAVAPAAAPAPAAAAATQACWSCSTAMPAGARFCPGCGASQGPRKCACGTENPPQAKFCSNCGNKF